MNLIQLSRVTFSFGNSLYLLFPPSLSHIHPEYVLSLRSISLRFGRESTPFYLSHQHWPQLRGFLRVSLFQCLLLLYHASTLEWEIVWHAEVSWKFLISKQQILSLRYLIVIDGIVTAIPTTTRKRGPYPNPWNLWQSRLCSCD